MPINYGDNDHDFEAVDQIQTYILDNSSWRGEKRNDKCTLPHEETKSRLFIVRFFEEFCSLVVIIERRKYEFPKAEFRPQSKAVYVPHTISFDVDLVCGSRMQFRNMYIYTGSHIVVGFIIFWHLIGR